MRMLVTKPSLPGFTSAVLTAHRLNVILQRTPEPVWFWQPTVMCTNTIDARHPSGATDWEEIHQDAIRSPSHQKHAPVSEVLMVTWGAYTLLSIIIRQNLIHVGLKFLVSLCDFQSSKFWMILFLLIAVMAFFFLDKSHSLSVKISICNNWLIKIRCMIEVFF